MSPAEVRLRAVEDADLDVFFAHQADPVAVELAASRPRDRAAFDAHWARIRADDTVTARTILADGVVAGGITSWIGDGQRLVGYWVGREHWGRGVATRALARFTRELTARPLQAFVAAHNTRSARVLEKCGFRRDHALEAGAPRPEDGIDEFIFVLTE